MGDNVGNFNLVDEGWIPVLWNDGKTSQVGIREALTQAGRVRQIAAANPMDRFAILRFLLAVLYWCKGNPPENASDEPKDSFPDHWFSKLDAHKDSFNLLGDGKRFFQNEKYKAIKPEHTINYLIHEVPSGTNKMHFRHSTDGDNGLCLPCCAKGLLRLPVFATSGGRGMAADSGKSPGINSKPPLYFIPVGNTLASSLRLSWTEWKSCLGTPEWETPNKNLPSSGEVPLLAGLTWIPRNVWLGNPEESETPCIACGRGNILIKRCVFDGKGTAKAENRIWKDPHVIYMLSPKDKLISLQSSDALSASDAAAAQWTKILEGICEHTFFYKAREIWVVGFSSVQNDKYLEALEYTFSLPNSLKESCESVIFINNWQKELRDLPKRLFPNDKKKKKRKNPHIISAHCSISPHVETEVSKKADELIIGKIETWEKAAEEYRPMMRVIAKSLSPGFTTAALEWRRQIENAKPNMRPRAEKPEKKRRGKGEKQ